MTALLSTLLSYILLYKYIALFAIGYAAALIVPLPVTILLLAVGAFSSQGYINIFLAFIVAIVSNVLGDVSAYAVTRIWGEPVIKKLHLNKFRFYEELQAELRSDAAITVFTTRLAGSLGNVANFLAGLVKINPLTFLLYDFLGDLIEPIVALTVGRLVGNYWNNFSNLFTLIASIIAVIVIIFILWKIYLRFKRRHNKSSDLVA